MHISWHGGSTISLHTKKHKAVVNATDKKHLKDAQLVLYGYTDDKNMAPEEGLMVDWPGEYDTAGFVFKGIEYHGKKGTRIVYSFQSPAGNVAWLGAMAEYPDKEFIEKLGEVHVLVLPVGGKDVLNGKDAFRLVEALEPIAVIPICYGGDHDSLKDFLKEMDVKLPEAEKKFELKKSLFGEESMDLVILEEV